MFAVIRTVAITFAAAMFIMAGAPARAQVKAVISGDDYFYAEHTGHPENDSALVYMDGSQSEGGIVYWEWSVSGFNDYFADGPEFAGNTWTLDRGEQYPFILYCYVGLYVEDADGNSDFTLKQILVQYNNQYTVANAGPDQSHFAPFGLDVTLHGSGSDPDGDEFWVADWWDVSESNSYGYRDWNPTLFLFPGVHEFELWVWDPYAYDYCKDFGSDRVIVTVYGSWIDSLNKTSAYAGEFAPTLTVTGRAFRKGAVITWNGAPMPTTFLSPTQLRTKLTAEQVALAGVFKVGVDNPEWFWYGGWRNGGFSNTVDFTVLNRAPMVSSLSPSSMAQGSPGFTLTLTGERFAPNSVVLWNGAPRATTFVSRNSLQIEVSAADIAVAGKAAVQVVNPAPGGGYSNTKAFTILP